MSVNLSHVWDVQASEPWVTPEGEVKYRTYANVRLHILAPTMERCIELMHEHHPQVRLHQIIKRSSVDQVIVDPYIITMGDEVS